MGISVNSGVFVVCKGPLWLMAEHRQTCRVVGSHGSCLLTQYWSQRLLQNITLTPTLSCLLEDLAPALLPPCLHHHLSHYPGSNSSAYKYLGPSSIKNDNSKPPSLKPHLFVPLHSTSQENCLYSLIQTFSLLPKPSKEALVSQKTPKLFSSSSMAST